MSWKDDKVARTEYYFKYVFGWKLRKCTACNGSGYYDNCTRSGKPIPCGSCEGTGKERYKPISESLIKE